MFLKFKIKGVEKNTVYTLTSNNGKTKDGLTYSQLAEKLDSQFGHFTNFERVMDDELVIDLIKDLFQIKRIDDKTLARPLIKAIKARLFGRNKASTAKRKGFNMPLYHTGGYVNSLQSKRKK
jgi:hypothetical protein